MKYPAQNLIKTAVSAIDPFDENRKKSIYFYNLGNAFKKQGKLDQAIECYQKAIRLNPQFTEAYNNLGNAYKFKECRKEALFYYQKAVDTKPEYAAAHYNIAILFKDQGMFQDAMAGYQQAISFRPDFVEAHFNLGNTFREMGKVDEAIRCYHTALEINPDYAEAYNGLGAAFQEQGKIADAFSCYQKHMQIKSDAAIEVKISLLLPVICDSAQSICNDRKAISGNIDRLNQKNLYLHDPFEQIGQTNFFLAYHGLNNKRLQKKIASFYLRACPDLSSRPIPDRSRRTTHSKIKIGIISRYLTRHTIGHLNFGIIKYLDRKKFHVTVFSFQGQKDNLSAAIARAADETITLPTNLPRSRRVISQHALDILFYTDIGMDPFTYFLAFSRLATVQCTSWGHPDTTGIPNIDYYISSAAAEPLGAQDHYSEQLVLLNKFAMYCRCPEKSERTLKKEDLGLPGDCQLYACVQSVFKVHPDFDSILEAILKHDLSAVIVFFETKHSHWTNLLRKRLARRLPDLHHRIRFLNRLPEKDFLSFLALPEVLLDTPHFSGGYTSLLAFARAAPIVTWPGKFMRGRLTYAFYKQMGIMDCVAGSFEAYVKIALRLASEKVWNAKIRSKIKARAHLLFDDMDPVHELEQFFEWVYHGSRKASIRSHSSS